MNILDDIGVSNLSGIFLFVFVIKLCTNAIKQHHVIKFRGFSVHRYCFFIFFLYKCTLTFVGRALFLNSGMPNSVKMQNMQQG